jgi:hypothetical protein
VKLRFLESFRGINVGTEIWKGVYVKYWGIIGTFGGTQG